MSRRVLYTVVALAALFVAYQLGRLSASPARDTSQVPKQSASTPPPAPVVTPLLPAPRVVPVSPPSASQAPSARSVRIVWFLNTGKSLTGTVTNTGNAPLDHLYLRVVTPRMPQPMTAPVGIISATPSSNPDLPPRETMRTLLQPGERGGVTLYAYPAELQALEVFTLLPGDREQPIAFTQGEDTEGFRRQMDKANEDVGHATGR